MRREKEDTWIIIEDALGAVSMMHVPIDDCHALNFRIMVLRISRGDRHIVEETKTHGSLGGRVMARRPYRHKRIRGLSLHDEIDRFTGSAGAVQSRIK